MYRMMLLGLLGTAALALASGLARTVADDKNPEKKTLVGTFTCTKCALGETNACGHALIVKDGDKKLTYYLVDKGGKEPYHGAVCSADVPGTKVTGKVVEKNKKLYIEEPKVELPKS